MAGFTTDFVWGAATSAYQVEGSPLADGAAPSNWHKFSHTPNCVHNGDTGNIAADHYRRFANDVKLMSDLGLKAYRFSVSWSRVIPHGQGKVNPKGLDFYKRLIDCLLSHDIAPYLTLYHWDLPLALDEKQGWLNADIAHWFADYAQVLFRAFGDCVQHWMTINEPWVIAHVGYCIGEHAPGIKDFTKVPIVSHNLLRAHANAVAVFRTECQGKIGLVVNLEPKYPASEDELDRLSADRMTAYMNSHYLDPLLLGRYPQALVELFGDAWPEENGDASSFQSTKMDFLGINYYSRAVVKYDPHNPPFATANVYQDDCSHTEMGWEVYPQGLIDILHWVKDRYGDLPLYITENGAAFHDSLIDGRVHDQPRVDYLKQHFAAVKQVLHAGIQLKGYFAWSLLDNFEWAYGYSKRFGLIFVDFETQQRYFKDSAYYYQRVISTNGVERF